MIRVIETLLIMNEIKKEAWNWNHACVSPLFTHRHPCVWICEFTVISLTLHVTNSPTIPLYTNKIKGKLWKQKFICSLSLPSSHYGIDIKENPVGSNNYSASLKANKIKWNMEEGLCNRSRSVFVVIVLWGFLTAKWFFNKGPTSRAISLSSFSTSTVNKCMHSKIR